MLLHKKSGTTSQIGVNQLLELDFTLTADADARVCAAATVLIVDTPVRERFGGIQGRLVPYPATSPLAENWALLQAILWTISILNQIGNIDSLTFPFMAMPLDLATLHNGTWTPQSHQAIADACRNLLLWIQERNGQGCQWCESDR